jgi:hypothetical protein
MGELLLSILAEALGAALVTLVVAATRRLAGTVRAAGPAGA